MNGNERALVTEARAKIESVRADPTAVWPSNALETAEARLTQALKAGPDTPAMTAEERALVLDARANVRIVRADPTAVWPPNALETAERLLNEALEGAEISLKGVAVTYLGHGQARDVYHGHTDQEVQWGRHDQWPLIAPSAGRVERYDFGTPLMGVAAEDPEYAQRHRDLFDGWVCMVPPDTGLVGLGGQTMHVAVFWPDQPLQTSGGPLRASRTVTSPCESEPWVMLFTE